ncbi:MAG: LysE family transporter [Desulfobacterales bacterium]|nr:LysE family transporter [Desulfobacterales bacterium]
MNLLSILISVASIWALAVVTPGPNFFITARTTVKESRFAGFFVVLGNCTGTAVWSAAGFFGITAVFAMAPWLYTTLKIAGGSYLIYLGLMMIRRSRQTDSGQGMGASAVQSRFAAWRSGVITNLSNPKTAMFVTSLFASVLPESPAPELGMAIISLMVAISFIWYAFVVLIFSSRGFKACYTRLQGWLEGLAGVIFIGFGAKLILQDK